MAAVDYYLKSTDWPGESKQKDHTGEIEVMSFSWGGKQPIDPHGAGHSTGKIMMDPLIITKHVDKSSPKLLGSLSKGTHTGSAILYCLKSTGKGSTEVYLTITLTDCFVSSYQLIHPEAPVGESKTEVVTTHLEKVSLYYNKIEFEHKAQDNTGALKTSGSWTLDVVGGATS